MLIIRRSSRRQERYSNLSRFIGVILSGIFLCSPCVAQIGLKSDNLILADLGTYRNCLLFAEAEPTASAPSLKMKQQDNSWRITEPLGGIVGGALFTVIYGGIGLLAYSGGYEQGGLILMAALACIGCSMGTGWGIWFTGEHIEKEKGSLLASLLGSISGFWGCFALTYDNSNNIPVSILGSLAGGFIGYRTSLPR